MHSSNGSVEESRPDDLVSENVAVDGPHPDDLVADNVVPEPRVDEVGADGPQVEDVVDEVGPWEGSKEHEKAGESVGGDGSDGQ